MEALLEKLEEECECPICSEILQQPKTFSCLHTFCLPCLNKLAEKHRADEAVPCPKCRKQIPIPHDGTFETATSSFLHNRLVELLNIRTSSHKKISCGNCKKETADCSFCFDCSKIYCSSCVEAHGVLKAEHKVRALKDFHTEDYQDFLQRPMLCCEKFHESQPLVFYCKHCQTCLCQLCVVVKQKMHLEHEIIPLDEAAEMKKVSLLTNIGKLEQKRQLLDKGVQEIDKVLNKIDENINSAKAEVKQFADFLVANILQHSKTSLAELETVRISRKAFANQKKVLFVEEREQVNDAIKFGTTLVNSKATKELLREEDINKHFEGLLNVERDIMEETKVNTFVKFIPGSETRFIGTEAQQIGQIFTDFSDSSKSQLVNKLVVENQAGLKVSGLSVVTKSSDGERHYLPTDNVELIVEPAMDVSDLQVIDHRNSSYDLTFVPRFPGRYEVQVKLNGHNIAGSPVEMFVTERKLTRTRLGNSYFTNKEEKDKDSVLIDYVKDTIYQLSLYPGELEAIVDGLVETMEGCIIQDETLAEIANLIVTQAVTEPSFTHIGARLANLLDKNMNLGKYTKTKFRDFFLRRCNEELLKTDELKSNPSSEPHVLGFAKFLAELFCNFRSWSGNEPFDIFHKALLQMLYILIEHGSDEAFRCIGQIMKMAGYLIDDPVYKNRKDREHKVDTIFDCLNKAIKESKTCSE